MTSRQTLERTISAAGSALVDPKTLYIDLVKRCVTNWIYADGEQQRLKMRGFFRRAFHLLAGEPRRVKVKPFDPALRSDGRDWPASAHTMIGLKRLDNLQWCVEEALRNGVPGDFIETGVWRGGAMILVRAILKAWGVKDRVVWVADSFEGLPAPAPGKYPEDARDRHHLYKQLAVPLEEVQANFERYGLLDEQVRFLKGWFSDTLASAPIERLAVARLDGDMYGSTMDALTSLYPKLSPGGFLIVDDYGALTVCKQAVEDYRAQHRITQPIVPIDWTGVYWRRES
jgi:O-methyltransferase